MVAEPDFHKEPQDPDPVTVTIAAIAMLASVGSLVINIQNQAERRRRERRGDAIAKRQLLRDLGGLQKSCASVEKALDELAKIVLEHSGPYDPRGSRPFSPSRRMLLPPSVASRYFLLTDRVTRAISAANKKVADILDGMDNVGYDGRAINELIEQNEAITSVLKNQPPIQEALGNVQDIAEQMKRTLGNIEREIATSY